jgi:hypothetical protein
MTKTRFLFFCGHTARQDWKTSDFRNPRLALLAKRALRFIATRFGIGMCAGCPLDQTGHAPKEPEALATDCTRPVANASGSVRRLLLQLLIRATKSKPS